MIRPEQMLEGYTVVEVVASDSADVLCIAVSFAGRLLTDLGAQVVRVAPAIDPLTQLKSAADESVGQTSVLATYLNRNKRLVDGVDLYAVPSDIVPVHLVLADEEIDDLDEAIGQVITSAFHQDMQPQNVEVSELGIQGLVGLTDLFGEPGEQPLMMGGHQTAYATGYSIFCAAMANLAALRFHRQAHTMNVNAVDALAWVNWKGVAAGALGFPVVRGGKAAEAPVVKCADGHFAFMHLPANWEDIRAEIDDPRLDDEQFARPGRRAKNAAALNLIIAEWAAHKTWASLYEFCQRCAIPGGPILHGGDLLDDPLYKHRNYFESAEHQVGDEWVQLRVPAVPMTVEGAANSTNFDKEAAATYSSNTPLNLPLSGKLVLDLGIFTAGSVTSTLLADLGATVIKVESESYSDPFRIWPGLKGDSPLFTFNNRNKLGLNLDLKSEEGRAKFLELVKQADVVVENFRRGVLARLGIDYPTLREVNPGIVLASISGQGASGPGSGHVSFGSTLEAIGGVAALTGYPDKGCYISGRNLNYPDQIVCLYGAGAVMAALMKAQDSGYGMHIDVSQREVTTLAVGEVVAAASFLALDKTFPGNGDLNAYLQDIFPVQDGWVCVTVKGQSQRQAIANFLSCEVAEIRNELGQWLAQQSRSNAVDTLRSLEVAVFPANTGEQASNEVAITTGSAFAVTPSGKMVKGFPFQIKNSPLGIYEESPQMGEHTERILNVLKATS